MYIVERETLEQAIRQGCHDKCESLLKNISKIEAALDNKLNEDGDEVTLSISGPINITVLEDTSAVEVETKSTFSTSVKIATETKQVGDIDPDQEKFDFVKEEDIPPPAVKPTPRPPAVDSDDEPGD